MRGILAVVSTALGVLGLATAAQAAVLTYTTTLSGAAEDPPVASPGTGSATVVIDTILHTMDINVTFADLVEPTTVAHIHGPTLDPLSGNASVMTTTPSFPGFPGGVTSGTFNATFATDDAASYRPGFVTDSGSVALAESAFFAALAEGRTYLNIHTTFAPGGEIRGFLVPAPIPLPAGALLSLTALAALGALRRRPAT